MSPTRVVEVAAERYPAWRERFDQAQRDRAAPQRICALEQLDADPLGIVLVRRGGYAVGLLTGEELTAHKVGTRYVQSRTKKGGWSQQRYARRRAGQADGLVGAAVEQAHRLLPKGAARGLVVGGDRLLVEEALTSPRLAHLRDLARRELWDLPDPRLAVLRDAARRARAVRVTIEDPPPAATAG